MEEKVVMKKIPLFLIPVVVLVLAACPNPWTPVPAPSDFTQKVLLEEVTGTWCGWCTDGAVTLTSILDAHPGLVIGAAYHGDDPMEPSELPDLAAGLGNIKFYPSGGINRSLYSGNSDPDAPPIFMGREFWSVAVTQLLADTAKCGS
jgi:thiol-disulfide isomerase/thioredoxin